MNESDIYDEFEKLWRSFETCCRCAESLKSPNPRDNEFIKMAIVGFSCHDRTENWQQGHFEIANRYSLDCERLGDTDNAKRFNLLAVGALLGLYSAGKIDDRLYGIGYALLPGFVLSKGAEIQA